jgi:hypothetical protein
LPTLALFEATLALSLLAFLLDSRQIERTTQTATLQQRDKGENEEQ